jgi:hypothetical protein
MDGSSKTWRRMVEVGWMDMGGGCIRISKRAAAGSSLGR